MANQQQQYQLQQPQPPLPQPQQQPQPFLLSALNLNDTELFPFAATVAEMNVWFGNNIPANPLIQVIPGTNMYGFNQNTVYPYLPAGANAQFSTNDDHTYTVQREQFEFICHHGEYRQFDPANQNTYRSVSQNVGTSSTVNANHWPWRVGRGDNQQSNATWEAGVRKLITSTNTDARGYMVQVALRVWNRNDVAQPNDPWHAIAAAASQPAFATHLIRIALFYIHQSPADTPRIIKFLLGDRLRPHLDVFALYANQLPLAQMQNVQPNIDANMANYFIHSLRRWLELSCAHLLVEVFKNHIALPGGPTTASRNALRNNFRYVARRYPSRNYLVNNLRFFPHC